MAKIELTDGTHALVDDVDLPLVAAFRWWRHKGKRGHFYAATRFEGSRQVVLMHRYLMACPALLEVDHINNDGLDNQRNTNLRIVTHSQNMMNKRTPSHNKSGYKGVCWGKKEGKWVARITVNKRRISLGVFEDVHAAGRAYARASASHHGEHGRVC